MKSARFFSDAFLSGAFHAPLQVAGETRPLFFRAHFMRPYRKPSGLEPFLRLRHCRRSKFSRKNFMS